MNTETYKRLREVVEHLIEMLMATEDVELKIELANAISELIRSM